MSAFLGPIHYWLYNKIILFEELEKMLIDTYEDKYGNSVSEIFHKYCNQYANPIPTDEPLENIIDQNNIHGWLQQKISTAETRQAAFLTEIFDTYGVEAIELALEQYKVQGEKVGRESREKEMPSSATELFKTMNNYILDGMPCDHVNEITRSEEDRFEWETVSCLHIGYWQSANGNPDIFYRLRKQWIAAFIENANPEYKYTFQKNSNSLSHRIVKGGR